MEKLPRPAAILSLIITFSWGIAWVLAEAKLIPFDSKFFEPLLTVFGALTSLLVILVFATGQRDTPPERSNREQLIDTVRQNWIENVLYESLRDAQIQVDIEQTADQVTQPRYKTYELPIETVCKTDGALSPFEYSPTLLHQTFHALDGQLLILGAPGSGKTVLLLQLAEKLLDEAENKAFTPVPVVVNLSSWANQPKQTIADWLNGELQRAYGFGKTLTREWIGGDKLIFLLDGLDEVADAHRAACLDALNVFISKTRQVVVCSRIAEYEALSAKLTLSTAIQLQALPDARTEALLRDNIPSPETVDNILSTLQAHDEIWQEVNKPLFINILLNTYVHDKRKTFTKKDYNNTQHILDLLEVRHAELYGNDHEGLWQQVDIDDIRKRIERRLIRTHLGNIVIKPYVIQQLQQHSYADGVLNNAETHKTLAWIGHNLVQRNLSVFYVEMLQRDWLPRRRSQFGLIILNMLMIGLVSGLTIGLVTNIYVGLIFAVCFGLTTKFLSINLNQRLELNINKIIRLVQKYWIQIVLIELASVVTNVLAFGLLLKSSTGLSIGLLSGLFLGFINMLFVGISGNNDLTQRQYINQGLTETLAIGLLMTLISGLLLGFIFGLTIDLINGLNSGLVFGLTSGLSFGLLFGLGDVIRHLILRGMLWQQRIAPRRFDHFLQQMVERRLMRRVGGSVIFRHRYIMDYFADVWRHDYAEDFR